MEKLLFGFALGYLVRPYIIMLILIIKIKM